MKTLAFEIKETEISFGIKLFQTGKDKFVVQYDLQVDKNLSYSQACMELGRSIMHALACDSKISND